MKCKVLVLADSLQGVHYDPRLPKGFDPAWVYVATEVDFPDGEHEPPGDLLQAVRFARDAKVGEQGVINPEQAQLLGRAVIIRSFVGKVAGRPRTLRYVVGLTPDGPSEDTVKDG